MGVPPTTYLGLPLGASYKDQIVLGPGDRKGRKEVCRLQKRY